MIIEASQAREAISQRVKIDIGSCPPILRGNLGDVETLVQCPLYEKFQGLVFVNPWSLASLLGDVDQNR